MQVLWFGKSKLNRLDTEQIAEALRRIFCRTSNAREFDPPAFYVKRSLRASGARFLSASGNSGAEIEPRSIYCR
jgi:hypothetical protein